MPKAKKKSAKTATRRPEAPLPPEAAAEPSAPKSAPAAGPTAADYEALQRECDELRERTSYWTRECASLQDSLTEAEEVAALLSAGVNPKWTDAAIRGVFAEAQIDDGLLGACMAVLEGERTKAVLEAEALEQQGEPAQAVIGAARRLREVQERIGELYRKAKGLGDMDVSPKRASQY